MRLPSLGFQALGLLVWASALDVASAAPLSNGFAVMDHAADRGRLVWALEVDTAFVSSSTAELREAAASRLMHKKEQSTPANLVGSHFHQRSLRDDVNNRNGRDDNDHDHDRGHNDHHHDSGSGSNFAWPCAIGFGVVSMLFIVARGTSAVVSSGSSGGGGVAVARA